MFSKELQLMDQNTVKYMMDELQEQLDSTQEQLNSTQEQLDSANTTISTLSEKNAAQADEIVSKDNEIARLHKLLEANNIQAN